MREITINTNLPSERAEATSASRSFWSAVLILSAIGSVGFLVGGLSLSLLSVLGVINTSRVLAYSSIALLFGSFILMFLAAHGMDRRDAAEKEERLEKCRRDGLRDAELLSRR